MTASFKQSFPLQIGKYLNCPKNTLFSTEQIPKSLYTYGMRMTFTSAELVNDHIIHEAQFARRT